MPGNVRIMVPTVWCEVMLSQPMTAGGKDFKIGDLMRVPYGVALQGIACGTFSVIADSDNVHAQAVEHLQQYGPDSWFNPTVQTIGKFWNYITEERRKRGENPPPAVPTTPEGETIH